MYRKLNKFVFAIVLCAGVSCGAQVANCDGGEIITGENNHEYCLSNITMNWWSAFSWCRANHRTLASITQACDGVFPGMWASCDNLKNRFVSRTVWLETPYKEGQSYTLYENSRLSTSLRNRTYFYALCF